MAPKHPLVGQPAPALELPCIPEGDLYRLPIGEKVCRQTMSLHIQYQARRNRADRPCTQRPAPAYSSLLRKLPHTLPAHAPERQADADDLTRVMAIIYRSSRKPTRRDVRRKLVRSGMPRRAI